MQTLEHEATIDAAQFAKIREYMGEGDPGVFAELLKIYLCDSGQELGELRAALEKFDASRVERTAHKLRGSSCTIGAQRLSQLSQRIEDEAKYGRTAGLETLVKTAEEEFVRVRAELEPLSLAAA